MSQLNSRKEPQFLELDQKSLAVFRHKGYELLEKLGEGAFGQVFKSRKLNKSKISQSVSNESRSKIGKEKDGKEEFYAVKVQYLDKMPEKMRSKFLPREILALTEVKHPNIVQVFDIMRANQKIFIIMEFAGEGDLNNYVRLNDVLTEPLSRYWFRQVTDAVNYLHNTLTIAHRDIKLENVLLDAKYDTKLTDFGFAAFFVGDTVETDKFISKTMCGTEPYYSPELASRVPYNPFKADCWAMGVLLYTMTHKRRPYHPGNIAMMIYEMMDYPKYIRGRFRANATTELKTLLEKMLNPNETDRFSIAQTMESAWLTTRDENFVKPTKKRNSKKSEIKSNCA